MKQTPQSSTAKAPADYLSYWKAEQPVFLSVAETGDLYVPSGLRPVLDRLLVFCRQSSGIVLVTGEAGTGKTTLARWLFASIETSTHEVLLTAMVSKEHHAGWLTPRIAQLMGVKIQGTPEELMRATVARFDELIQERRRLVVMVDAAHLGSSPDAWTEVVALLNLQSHAQQCLSFVLIGEPELRDVVEKTPGLATKLAFVMALPRLSRDETEAYVDHRLKKAGLATPFDPEALDLIHVQSRGVIAQVNNLAENCLVETCQRQGRRITADVARAAQAHVSLGTHEPAMPEIRAAAGDAAIPRPSSRKNELPPPPVKTVEAKPEARADSSSIKLSSLFKSKT